MVVKVIGKVLKDVHFVLGGYTRAVGLSAPGEIKFNQVNGVVHILIPVELPGSGISESSHAFSLVTSGSENEKSVGW
jgi:hypothetical protein